MKWEIQDMKSQTVSNPLLLRNILRAHLSLTTSHMQTRFSCKTEINLSFIRGNVLNNVSHVT